MPTLRGTSKRDVLRGTAVAETILGLAGADDLYGKAGNDTIKGGTGNDKLLGGLGNDKLRGEAGNDTLKGEAGNDTLTGGGGNDTLAGGGGTDTAELATSWLAATVTAVAGGYRIAGPAANGTDTATGVERFKFTNGTFTAAQILNDAPVASADSGFSTAEDTPLTITAASLLANDTDADTALGDSVSLLSVQGAVNGTVQIVSGDVQFTPVANYNGPASFTYTIKDAKGTTATATVNPTVTPVSDAPVAVDDTASTLEDTPVDIGFTSLLANDSDVDGGLLSITAVGSATGGTAIVAGAKVIFTPDADFNGTASFVYTLSDGTTTDNGLVNVTVTGVNDAPTGGSAPSGSGAAGAPVTLTTIASLLASFTDVDGDTLSIVSVTDTDPLGTVAISGSNLVYTPGTAGFHSYTVTISDGNGEFAQATGSLTASPGAPFAQDDNVNGSEDNAIIINAATLLANDNLDVYGNVHGQSLSISSVSAATNGTVSITSGVITFTPNANYNGSAGFDYTLNTGDTGHVTLQIAAVDDPTVISNLVVTEAGISFTASDVDGVPLMLTAPFATVFGNPAINNGTPTFLAVSEQATAVSGTLQVTDSLTAVDVIELYLGTASSDSVNRTSSTTDAVIYGFGGLDGLGGGTGAETFFGGSGGTNGIVTGGNGSDMLVGGDDADELSGGFGADTLRGGGGADTLEGGGDGDTLFGGNGDDTLDGQDGNDTLTGDAGNDTFRFSGLSGTPASSDIITDFTSVSGTGGDKVELLNTYPFGVWSVEEVGSDTLFKFKETTSLPGFLYMTVTVSGVTGMVAGDDYVIV